MPLPHPSRRALIRALPAAACVLAAGCSPGGALSGAPKKYEGGGPMPEFVGEEVSDHPVPKTRPSRRRPGR